MFKRLFNIGSPRDTLGIRELPWHTYQHAYGKASDVPDQILALLSPDKATRTKAFGDLYGNIYHQGSIYEATQHAVPFLIRIAGDDAAPDRADVLNLIADIGEGGSWHHSHKDLSLLKDKASTPEFQSKMRAELSHAAAAHRAVITGIPVYVSLLSSSDPLIREAAAYTLSRFPRDATSAIPALIEQAQRDPDEEAAATAILALARFQPTQPQLESIRAARSNPPPSVHLALALADITALSDKAPSASIDTAFAALNSPPNLSRQSSRFFDGGVQALVVGTLYALPPELSEQHLDELLQLFASDDQYDPHWLITLLILILFPPPRKTTWNPADFTTYQRRFIITMFDNRRTFSMMDGRPSILVNNLDPLKACGLPTNFEKFKDLADQCRAIS